MRTITVNWNQRNIDRIHSLLKLESDFCGFFRRKGNDEIIGYKTCRADKMTFHFHNEPKPDEDSWEFLNCKKCKSGLFIPPEGPCVCQHEDGPCPGINGCRNFQMRRKVK